MAEHLKTKYPLIWLYRGGGNAPQTARKTGRTLL